MGNNITWLSFNSKFYNFNRNAFSKEGYNVLIPSMRACSESDGEYIGMGWLDKEDLQCWINLIIKQMKMQKLYYMVHQWEQQRS